ncbi:right-handed parallel beta-helix repeat-containing protein [Reichenbachiella sp.]
MKILCKWPWKHSPNITRTNIDLKIEPSAIAVNGNPTRTEVHNNLLFENNTIEGEGAKYGIYVSGADSVTISNNEISGCEIPIHKEV